MYLWGKRIPSSKICFLRKIYSPGYVSDTAGNILQGCMVGALYKPKSIGFGYLQIKFILDLPAAYGLTLSGILPALVMKLSYKRKVSIRSLYSPYKVPAFF
jgi:hypothetical protein